MVTTHFLLFPSPTEHTFSDDESDGESVLDFDDDESDSEAEPQTQTDRLGDEDITPRVDGHASLAPTSEEGGVIAAVSKDSGDHERPARNSNETLSEQLGRQRFYEMIGQEKAEAASLSTGNRQENSPDRASASNRMTHESATHGTGSSSSSRDLATPARDRRESARDSLAEETVKAKVGRKGLQGGQSGREGALSRHQESISSANRTPNSVLFETPSRNRARDDHVVAANDASGVSRGETALDPALVTPFRSRDRDGPERSPPLIGVLPAGGSTSRRINRTRNGEKTVRDHVRAPVVVKVPTARSQPNPKPSPPPIVVQLDEKPRPASMGRKRFTFTSDTSWLKPRDALEHTATALQVVPKTTAPVATNMRVRKSFTLPPARVAEWGRLSPPPPSVPEWRTSSFGVETSTMKTLEMEKQLRQDMASAAYPEPESGMFTLVHTGLSAQDYFLCLVREARAVPFEENRSEFEEFVFPLGVERSKVSPWTRSMSGA